MVEFSPQITIVTGSVVSICCSIFCAILFYYWWRDTRKTGDEMQNSIDKLSAAFIAITNVLIGEKTNETHDVTEQNGPLYRDPIAFPNSPVDSVLRNIGKTETGQVYNERESD
jgi:hypothetical protein